MIRTTLPALAALCLLASTPAQRPVGASPSLPAAAAPFANTGLGRDDAGCPVGVGPDYVVHFGAEAVRFTPALGKAAPHDLPLAYRLQAIGRGANRVAVPSAAPQPAGAGVVYRHGIVEATYELRLDGVKQGFVFADLPDGEGDLVVRAAIDTALPVGEITQDGIEFVQPGVGGVRVGAVLGIDAAGRTAAGSMRWADGALEFVLPAAFVDTAALPLVLDPLLGSVITLGGANDDLVPDVAYDPSTDSYLVVWQRDLSLLNQDIRGQRLTATGSSIGGTLALESSTTVSASRPKVANVNLRNAFVVVWQQSGDIQARGVDAATGTLTAAIAVAATTDTESQPDIAGEDSDSLDDDALCVWANTNNGDIEARQVTYTSSGTLGLGLLVSFANPLFSTLSNPSISQHGGGTGHHLICWDSYGSLSSSITVRGCIVDRNLGLVVSPFGIATGTFDVANADCDGDGDAGHWVVAYEREEAAGGDTDIVAVPVHRFGAAAVVGVEMAVAATPADDERDPAVCWLQDSCLIAYADEGASGEYDTYVNSVSPLRCTSCEGGFALDIGTARSATFPAIAWRYQRTGADNNDALVVWQSFDLATNTGDTYLRRFAGDDGFVRRVADGCGAGGEFAAKCARGGNSTFRFELRGGPPNAQAFLVLAATRLNLVCGPCVLVPDPWLGFAAGFTGTNASGDASWLLVLPPGVGGIDLYAQWLGTGSLCLSGLDLSSAALVRVQ